MYSHYYTLIHTYWHSHLYPHPNIAYLHHNFSSLHTYPIFYFKFNSTYFPQCVIWNRTWLLQYNERLLQRYKGMRAWGCHHHKTASWQCWRHCGHGTQKSPFAIKYFKTLGLKWSSDGADFTSSGRLFQSMLALTLKLRFVHSSLHLGIYNRFCVVLLVVLSCTVETYVNISFKYTGQLPFIILYVSFRECQLRLTFNGNKWSVVCMFLIDSRRSQCRMRRIAQFWSFWSDALSFFDKQL